MQSGQIEDWDDEVNRYRRNKRVSFSAHHIAPVHTPFPSQPPPPQIPEDDDDDFEDSLIHDDMPTIREVEESKEVLAPLSPPAHAPSLMSDIGSDEEDNSERWNQRPMPLWIELRATENPGFRVYLNTETNELSAVNPDALDDPDADATLARAWNPRQSRAIDESDEAAVKARAAHRCRECVDSMARQADLCLAQAPHVSPEMADAAAALKQAVVAARSALVTTSLKGVEAEEATVVDFLVGWKQLRWDFANNSAVDYFRASAARTDLQSVGFSQ